MDSLGTGVVLHAPDTSIIFSNPRASEIMGISHEQMQGKKAISPHWRFVRNDGIDMPLEEYPVNKALKLMNSFSEYIIGIKHPNRKYITWVNVNASLVFNNNNIKYVTISFNDITEQKRAEEELINHQKHLEELVNERTKELDEKNKELNNSMKVFVGRELTIRDLQKRIKVLEGK
ncbi:MAG: PAS domain S-box protein [Melioribacteraceae bacterium]|nr:PAS domain S-box protein [Melioribacteraceae bacterium]